MSIIDSGKYRLRKDWASASIPSLVNIDEHDGDSGSGDTEGSLNVTAPLPPQKPPRRSSLALGLFSSKSDKSQKRRSSIAVSFLRRDSSKVSVNQNWLFSDFKFYVFEDRSLEIAYRAIIITLRDFKSFQRITSVILIQSPNILQLFQKYLTLTYK